MPDAQGQGLDSQIHTDTPRARGKDAERRPFEDAPFAGPDFVQPAPAQSDAQTGERSPYLTTPDIWRETWRPLAAMQTEMARWFDEVWREAASHRGGYINTTRGMPELAGVNGFAGLPRADMKETDKDYRLHVELPGLKIADVQLELEGDSLIVRGVKSDDQHRDGTNFHFTERRFGRVERRFALPRDVDADAVKADFRDGVLNVVLPKDATAEQRRRIEVRPG